MMNETEDFNSVIEKFADKLKNFPPRKIKNILRELRKMVLPRTSEEPTEIWDYENEKPITID